MKKFFSWLNIIFVVQIVTVILVAVGILPRFIILPLTLVLALYVLIDSSENSTVFFVRSIPFFVAIPFTSYFDSFNVWRILSSLIFIKWYLMNNITSLIVSHLKKLIRHPVVYFDSHHIITAVGIFFVMSLFSLLDAVDLFSGIKRIIYISNLSLIGFIIYWLVKKNEDYAKRIVENLLIPAILVVIIGFIQLISTYFISIYQFMDIWAFIIQASWYGNDWANTVAFVGNTWFSYFGRDLSLRMFSTFPDSHTFPMYILMSIPSLLSIALAGVISKAESWKDMMKTRASMWIVLLPVFYLAAILSGTRGIWLAIAGPIILLPIFLIKARVKKDRHIFLYLSTFFLLFFLLFFIANPILTSSQFQVVKGDSDLLKNRIKSILNLNEVSNNGRIMIWKASLSSIAKRPLLGVGIGNFPAVLNQDIELAKAGSSAHNLYLNIAAEIGLVGLFVALVFIWIVITRAFQYYKKTDDIFLKIYSASVVLYLIWVLFYSLTDAALFDERTFLLFVTISGIILGLRKSQVNLVSGN